MGPGGHHVLSKIWTKLRFDLLLKQGQRRRPLQVSRRIWKGDILIAEAHQKFILEESTRQKC